MSDRETEAEGSTLEPEEAFLLLAHEIRVKMLLALWEAPEFALSFSELRERVGVRDSAHFNYHLSKLVGRFVRRADDRYRLLYAGHRVVDAIQSGVFHAVADVGTIALDDDCPRCGSALAFEYEGHVASVSCAECDAALLEYPFDPGGVRERSGPEIAEAFDRRTRHVWRLAHAGVCPACTGPVGRTLVSDVGEGSDHYAEDHPLVASFNCRQCSFFSHVPVGAVTLFHPGVACFLRERGADVRNTRLWEFEFALVDDRLEIVSDDPPEAVVTIRTGDEKLRVTVDESVTVRPIDPDPKEGN